MNAVTGELVRVPGDGNCGYSVSGAARGAANALLEHLHDEDVRTVIGMGFAACWMRLRFPHGS